MTDEDPLVQRQWAEAAYTSAVPDFKNAPQSMFNAPYGWDTPDPDWQRLHQGWVPQPSTTAPVAGYPMAIFRWRFWIPKSELLRDARRLRSRRAAMYATYASLYSIGFLALIAGFFGLVFPPAAFFIVFAGGSNALAGSIALWLTMTPLVWSMDSFYLFALRLGKRKMGLFCWTLAPTIVLDVLITLALAWLFYELTAASDGGSWVSSFTLVGALLSLCATIPMLAMYALKELRLQS